MPRKSKPRSRYYYQYGYHDDLSRDEGWRIIYDRDAPTPQGETTPIAFC